MTFHRFPVSAAPLPRSFYSRPAGDSSTRLIDLDLDLAAREDVAAFARSATRVRAISALQPNPLSRSRPVVGSTTIAKFGQDSPRVVPPEQGHAGHRTRATPFPPRSFSLSSTVFSSLPLVSLRPKFRVVHRPPETGARFGSTEKRASYGTAMRKNEVPYCYPAALLLPARATSSFAWSRPVGGDVLADSSLGRAPFTNAPRARGEERRREERGERPVEPPLSRAMTVLRYPAHGRFWHAESREAFLAIERFLGELSLGRVPRFTPRRLAAAEPFHGHVPCIRRDDDAKACRPWIRATCVESRSILLLPSGAPDFLPTLPLDAVGRIFSRVPSAGSAQLLSPRTEGNFSSTILPLRHQADRVSSSLPTALRDPCLASRTIGGPLARSSWPPCGLASLRARRSRSRLGGAVSQARAEGFLEKSAPAPLEPSVCRPKTDRTRYQR
ncbi:hypothetical protein KM043_007298 [Ampulex compressa]|nr:hypothetical protein KM043_007298 [Ampulex compressa]